MTQWDVKAMGCQSQYRGSQSGNFGGRPMRQNWRQDSTSENDMWYGGRILGGRAMERKMSWTPTPSHLIKQMSRKRGPRHKGGKTPNEMLKISYPGSEKLMSFWAIFLVLHFASLICGSPWFGCAHPKGSPSHHKSPWWFQYKVMVQSVDDFGLRKTWVPCCK